MNRHQRWEEERACNSRIWRERIIQKSSALGVTVEIPDGNIHARTRLVVSCSHGTIKSPAYSFCSKCCCCRIGSNERRVLGEATIQKMKDAQHKSWLRTDRFWANPENLSEEAKKKPDLFYVAVKGELTKAGRIKPSTARTWFPRWDKVLAVWELNLEHSLTLERDVRQQFFRYRPLDSSFGKGWTELFSVEPNEIILFIEQRLRTID